MFELPGELDREVELLEAWCTEHDRWIGPGGTVTEDVAAELVERSPHTLREWRAGAQQLPFRRIAGGVRYLLWDIAVFRLTKSH